MAIILPPGIANVTWRYSHTGTEHISTFSCAFVREGTPFDDPIELAEAMYTAWIEEPNPGRQDWLISGWSLEAVSVEIGQVGDSLVGEYVDHMNGTYNVEALPINCAWLVRKVTGLSGRKNRGRMYLPAGIYLAESEVNAVGQVSTPTRTFLTNAFEAWLTGLAAVDVYPVLAHSDGDPATAVTALIPQGTIATQRRRMR